MHELVFDVIVGLIILGIAAITIKLFDSNLSLINASTNDKNVEISQISDGPAPIKDSKYYNGSDVLAYVNDSKVMADTSLIILIQDSGTGDIFTIDSLDRASDILGASTYLRGNLTSRYSFNTVSYTFVRMYP
ncbi:MAG TPA: hypothetical protein DCP90_00250 [Clostridiales bacterium]|nr:MAG: hypothetical protein A2Y22_04450 [Clostridiales bacterium GWD2_32_59]HAN09026.1 hypothetical protein [Clostridiales bacterium]